MREQTIAGAVSVIVTGEHSKYEATGGFMITEQLPRGECVSLLGSQHVGRVGLSIQAMPAVLPVNYHLVGDALVFRASADSELFRDSVGSVIVFETDACGVDGTRGWSVLVRGVAEEITGRHEVGVMECEWHEAWPLGEQADRYVVLPLSLVRGWRFEKRAVTHE